MKHPNRLISIAPMMACTDKHYRYLMRLMTQRTLLYTEMVTAPAIVHGDQQYLLGYNEQETPLALQVGGSDPKQLAQACKIATHYHYDEINLNVGCPSSRVQSGAFGACLMKQPDLVARCVTAMQDATTIPITVKTRLGVDDNDSYAELCHFIETVAATSCNVFIMHARKAWLNGLSPKENRNVPPLMYERVYQLKQDFPQLQIIINGGVKSIADIQQHLQHVDGVMLGREAYANPYLFAHVDQVLFNDIRVPLSQPQVILQYLPYVAKQLAQGVPLRHMTRHLVGFFQGVPGARAYRRYLSEQANANQVQVLEKALALVA